ncbi:MAG: hypothetical protein ACRDTE_26370 [Pseudonocardiaceae bacterium]
MSDALSFAEIDGQHLEMLPARTVLSMYGGGYGDDGGDGGKGGDGGYGGDAKGGDGGSADAKVHDNYNVGKGDQYNVAYGGWGGDGGDAKGGDADGGDGGKGGDGGDDVKDAKHDAKR